MKALFYAAIFYILISSAIAQDISGKWVGKAFQGAGELCTECNFELDLLQNSTITGKSRHYQKDTTDITMNLSGALDGDTIRLNEFRGRGESIWIFADSLQACIKQYMLKYELVGNIEYLIGRGTGKGINDGMPCIPANFVFARNHEKLDSYPIKAEEPLKEFTPDFNNTIVNKHTEIEVRYREVQIRLSDYLQVDNDTVTVYLNRNIVAKNIRISKQPVRINLLLDNRTDLHEILLFAENLGKIPPNTSLMQIIDGRETHQLKIESDKQKTAAIYLRYKPNLK